MRLCWADKLGILWGFIVLTVMDVLSKQPLMEAPDFALAILFKLVIPVWLLLRMIDWCMDGPTRRRSP